MKVLDIDNIDLAMGKMMEQGPVLVITFNSQQILCVRDRTGKVIEGSPDKVPLLYRNSVLLFSFQVVF
jgi:mitochondrial import inner membrane translocase subunit TIM44